MGGCRIQGTSDGGEGRMDGMVSVGRAKMDWIGREGFCIHKWLLGKERGKEGKGREEWCRLSVLRSENCSNVIIISSRV